MIWKRLFPGEKSGAWIGRSIDADCLTGNRVEKGEPVSPKQVSNSSWHGVRSRDPAGKEERISEKRVTDGSEVDSNLVRASGFQVDVPFGFRIGAAKECAQATGGATVGRCGVDVAQDGMGNGCDRRPDIDGGSGGDGVGVVLRYGGNGPVSFDGAECVGIADGRLRIRVTKLPAERLCGALRACESDKAGRSATETVDGNGASGGCGIIVSDEIEEGIFEKSAAREDGQTGGFVDDEHLFIPIAYGVVERSGRFLPWGTIPEESVACPQGLVDEGGLTIPENFAGDDTGLPGSNGIVGIAARVVIGD